MRIRSLVLVMAYLVVPVSLAADDRVIIGKMDFTDAEIGSATTEVSGYDVELIFERGAALYGFTLGGYCHGTTQHLGIGLHPNFSTEGCVAQTEEYELRHNEARTDGSAAPEFDKDVIDVGQELWVLSARYNDPADLSWIAAEGGLLSVFGQEFSLTDFRGALDMVTGEKLRELEETLTQDYVGLNQQMAKAEAEFKTMQAQVSRLDDAVAGLRERVDAGAGQEELQAYIAEQNFANFTDLEEFAERAEEARDGLQGQVASNVEHINSLAEWADGVEDRLANIEDSERDQEEFLTMAESSETPGAEATEPADDTSAAGSDTRTTIGDTMSEVADATSWAWLTQMADQVRMVHLALGLAVLATIGVILLTFLKAPLRGLNKVKKAAESAKTAAGDAMKRANQAHGLGASAMQTARVATDLGLPDGWQLIGDLPTEKDVRTLNTGDSVILRFCHETKGEQQATFTMAKGSIQGPDGNMVDGLFVAGISDLVKPIAVSVNSMIGKVRKGINSNKFVGVTADGKTCGPTSVAA